MLKNLDTFNALVREKYSTSLVSKKIQGIVVGQFERSSKKRTIKSSKYRDLNKILKSSEMLVFFSVLVRKNNSTSLIGTKMQASKKKIDTGQFAKSSKQRSNCLNGNIETSENLQLKKGYWGMPTKCKPTRKRIITGQFGIKYKKNKILKESNALTCLSWKQERMYFSNIYTTENYSKPFDVRDLHVSL